MQKYIGKKNLELRTSEYVLEHAFAYRESSENNKDDDFFFYQALLYSALNNLQVFSEEVGETQMIWSFDPLAVEVANESIRTNSMIFDPTLKLEDMYAYLD